MKIVDISEFYSPTSGGVRTYVDHKFKAAARHGHRLVVVAPGTETRVEKREGGKLVWVKAPQLPMDKNYCMFWRADDVWRVLDDEAPDVVEGSSPWRGGWLAAKWPGPAVKMLFMHADPVAVYPQTLLGGVLGSAAIDRMFGWFWSYLRRLNHSFDHCIIAGTWLAHRFAGHGLRNLHVVPFGVDAQAFGAEHADAGLRAAMLEKCGLGPEASLLVTVGRHHPEKRVGMLIEAVTRAQRESPIGLYIIGDGLAHARIRGKAARAAHVHVAGRVTDRAVLARLMASADALLHGSSAETYGFVVAEALCSGTPLIVPNAGGAGDLASADYAEIYASGDKYDAAEAILRLIRRDRSSLSSAAIRASRMRVGDIESHFDKLFDFYADAVRRDRTAQAVPVHA